MNNPQQHDADCVIAHFRCWIERVVIGLALCPFAREPYENGRVRYVASDAGTRELLLAELQRELEWLREAGAGNTETTLLIHPYVLLDFLDYNDFLGVVEGFLEQGGYAGEFQVASFHPDYRFAGTKRDDAENYTNRAPYPALHILREASIEQALAGFADPDRIPERNIRTMEKLGVEQLRAILTGCLAKRV